MSDPNNPQGAYLTPEQQAALAAHRKTVDDLVEYGRTAHGADSFDTASQIVADKLGNEATQLLVASAAEFDCPDRMITYLADNPAELERFAGLPLAQRVAELGRLEARFTPHRARVGADPAWRATHRQGGRVSEADWKRGYGDQLSDKQWHAEFSRRQKERGERRR
jgi:hypothetical protein